MLFQHEIYHCPVLLLPGDVSPPQFNMGRAFYNFEIYIILPRKAVVYIWYISCISLVPQNRINLVRVTASMYKSKYLQTQRPGEIKKKKKWPQKSYYSEGERGFCWGAMSEFLFTFPPWKPGRATLSVTAPCATAPSKPVLWVLPHGPVHL